MLYILIYINTNTMWDAKEVTNKSCEYKNINLAILVNCKTYLEEFYIQMLTEFSLNSFFTLKILRK